MTAPDPAAALAAAMATATDKVMGAEPGTHVAADYTIIARATLAALPPGWCGHAAEIERLREGIRILQANWPKTIPAPMDFDYSRAALKEQSDGR